MGISLTTPLSPKRKLQSLPSMLRIISIRPIWSCSKAPRVFSSNCRYPASLPELHFHRASPWDSFPVVTPFVHVGTYPTRKYALFFLYQCIRLSVYVHNRTLSSTASLLKVGCVTFGLLLVTVGLCAHYCTQGNCGSGCLPYNRSSPLMHISQLK